MSLYDDKACARIGHPLHHWRALNILRIGVQERYIPHILPDIVAAQQPKNGTRCWFFIELGQARHLRETEEGHKGSKLKTRNLECQTGGHARTGKEQLPLDAHAGDYAAGGAGNTLEAVRLIGNHGPPVWDAQEHARVLQHRLIRSLHTQI